jgi:hypothetical protein
MGKKMLYEGSGVKPAFYIYSSHRSRRQLYLAKSKSVIQPPVILQSTAVSHSHIFQTTDCVLKGYSDENFLLRILKDSSLCIFKSIEVP